MMKYEAGFIGAGNMGGALALAAMKKVGGDKVAVACSSEESTAAKAAKLGCAAAHAEDVIADSRYVFLGVKPQMLRAVVQSLEKPLHEAETVFVSMIAGVSLDTLAQLLGADRKIIRIMPNTACAVGQGVLLVCANANVTAQELAGFEEMMEHSGVVDRIDEKLIDAASAVSGCGPAYYGEILVCEAVLVVVAGVYGYAVSHRNFHFFQQVFVYNTLVGAFRHSAGGDCEQIHAVCYGIRLCNKVAGPCVDAVRAYSPLYVVLRPQGFNVVFGQTEGGEHLYIHELLLIQIFIAGVFHIRRCGLETGEKRYGESYEYGYGKKTVFAVFYFPYEIFS